MAEDLQKDILHLQETSPETVELEKKAEERAVVDRIIRGVNDTFEQDYDLPEYGLKFKIKIKAPNAIDTGKIHARTAAYLSGMNNYASEYIYIVYQTLSAIRVNGVEIPDFLAKDEEIYNLDVLYIIGRDYTDWLSTFRR
ncbi:tail assembly chaperone 1 [Bacillus phage Thurquoise]|nr:tail assembly chaperone 1 [Bacillus phage Thurquoise]